MDHEFFYNLIDKGGAKFFINLTNSSYNLLFRDSVVSVTLHDIKLAVDVCDEVSKRGFLPVLVVDSILLKEALLYIENNNLQFGCLFITNSGTCNNIKYYKVTNNMFYVAIAASITKNTSTNVVLYLE